MRVFRRAGDEFWWLDYTDGAGKRHRVKTSSKSKRAAEDLLAEVRADLKRVQLGLEIAPFSRLGTVGEAWAKWLKEWCPAASLRTEQRRYNANVRDSWLALEKLTELSGETIDRWLAQKTKAGQAARTVNGHRRILRCVINALIKKRLFRGVNPVKETSPLEEPEYAYAVLTEAEFWRLVPHLPDSWRDVSIVAFTTGLRRGEIFALRKDRNVVDLESASLTPRASNGRDMVKGKRVKSIPLMAESLEVLRRAWDAAAPGALLFPAPGGKMRSESSRTAEMLRIAMVRAGLVESWNHRCRRPSCGGKADAQPDEQQRRCPKCGDIMWAHPVTRPVRFHDLRHSHANYLLARGVDLAVVSRLLRHSSLEITQQIYAHRTVEHLREALNRGTVGTAERQLEQLAAAQVDPQAAAVIKEAAEKLALTRHHASNVVPFIKPETGK